MSGREKKAQRLQPKRRWKKEEIFALFIASIPLIGFIIFNGFPLIISFIGMFFNVDLYDLTNLQWNNFEAFKSVFIPGYAFNSFSIRLAELFYKSVFITLWIASTQLVTLGIAMFIATLLREKPYGAKLFQVLFFIPYICSTVAVSLMWRWMLAWEGGIINSILGTNIEWLGDTNTMTWCIVLATIWQAPGYGIVMYKAAFANINNSLYEAAELDGANAWQKFKTVTFPGIAPTTFFLLQAGVVAGLLTYDLATLIIPTSHDLLGGKDNMGLTLIRLVRELIQEKSTDSVYIVSCACVISWLIFLVTGVISVILFRQREKSAE